MAKEFDSVRGMIEALKPSYPVYCLRPDLIHQAAGQISATISRAACSMR